MLRTRPAEGQGPSALTPCLTFDVGCPMDLSGLLFTAAVFASMLITAHFVYSKRA
ncbi:MAG: hypothetical protein RXQ79_06730 [Acidilobus sp.]